MTAGDYVLGTHDAEVARLGLQHRVWRETMLAAWRRAGLRDGWSVMDVGAGPGYATADLSEWVGPAGEVVAVERSPRFVAALRERMAGRGAENVDVLEADLMELGSTATELTARFDMAWCRWVASFVHSPQLLAQLLSRALRPGGRVVLHEYADYASWRFVPPRPRLASFVAEVMATWRAQGGEPDVAARFTEQLRAEGFRIVSTRPLVFSPAPGDPLWQWPASFIDVNLARLRQLERVSEAWAEEVRAELVAAEGDPEGRMITPLVLEVIAERT